MKQKDMNHNLDVAKSHIKQAMKSLSGDNGFYKNAIESRILEHLEIAYQQATEISSEDWNGKENKNG
jgi:hypothetical protein